MPAECDRFHLSTKRLSARIVCKRVLSFENREGTIPFVSPPTRLATTRKPAAGLPAAALARRPAAHGHALPTTQQLDVPHDCGDTTMHLRVRRKNFSFWRMVSSKAGTGHWAVSARVIMMISLRETGSLVSSHHSDETISVRRDRPRCHGPHVVDAERRALVRP